MSSIAAELNSLATATVIDIYRRHLKPAADDAHYLRVSKIATAVWGVLVCIMALYAAQIGPLIVVVNQFGSFFYGSLLGVFALAIGTKRVNGHGAFVGLVAGMSAVAWVAQNYRDLSFLWHNVIGAVVVIVVGLAVSAATGGTKVANPTTSRGGFSTKP
jgi:Na+/proline symporter